MEYLMACKVCLATDVKLYEMCKYRLKTAYENLTGSSMSSVDCLQYVCSYCATMLKNLTIFREKCTRSHQLLQMLIKEHILVTTSQIKTIDRHAHNLHLPYTIQHIQNCDSTVTLLNCDSTVPPQNFDPAITPQNFSIVTVKDEDCHIKCDYNDDYDNNYDHSKETMETYNYSDGDQQNDSDEEPLSKKVKKKRKKAKTKPHKHSTVKMKKYDKVDIKTEGCQDFPTDNQNYATNDLNFPIYEQNYPTNEQNYSTNEQNYSTNEQNYSTNEQNYSTNDQNFPTIDQTYPTNDENFPTDDIVPNQVLDLETDHKLVILSKQEQIDEVLSRKNSANYLNSVYKCERCFKGFMTEATYKNHMARHDPTCGPVSCPACGTRWPHARALRAHTLISHERRYICKVCGHTSKSSHKAKEHSRWHAGVTFPCDSCDRRFSKSTSYLTHVRLRHATHVCSACGQSFIGENGLNMHKKKTHRDEKVEPSQVYECERCRVQFRNAAALQRHCGGSGGGCADTLHVCVQCGDHFASEQVLKEHTDMHLKSDALRTCSQCSRTFANERSLAAHVQRSHRTHAHAPRHCVCEVCGYKCMSASSLVNHQRVHSGDKPHACAHCHKRFSVAQRLQIHVRTHTGERPFQCLRCPKAFKHKAALNRHDRVHTGAKPYSCPQCGKRFSQSNSMKQHCAGVHMKTYIYSRRNKQ